MAYADALDALQNGIDIIEDLANGEHGGAGAYWYDAEQFFREAEWELLYDLEVSDRPMPWGLSYDPELPPPPPPRPDTW